MSANELSKLLDSGHMVVLYRNPMRSYTAAVLVESDDPAYDAVLQEVASFDDMSNQVTDDFTVDKACERISEKFLGLGEYENWPPKMEP